MANIKQIKIGNTTYNIEPYTDYLPKTGGTLTGSLEVQGNINVAGNGTIKINAKEVALKSDIPTDYLPKTGGSVNGNLAIGGDLDVQGVLTTGQKQVALKSDVTTEETRAKAAENSLSTRINTKVDSGTPSLEMNSSGALKGYGGHIDFHFYDTNGKPHNQGNEIVATTPDYSSRIIETKGGTIQINGQEIAWDGISSGGTINAKTLKQDGKSVATVGTETGKASGSNTSLNIPTYRCDGFTLYIEDNSVSVCTADHTHTQK